jgi:hypothetical protein
VIAIIAILIALLLPVINKVRRKAVVLACPIVYQSRDDNALHITDPHGSHDLAVTPSYGDASLRRPGNPMWSPSGQKIGFELSNWSGTGPQYMCILDPMSGAIMKHPQIAPKPRNYFKGWVDNDHFIEGDDAIYYVRDADTGAVCQTIKQDTGIAVGPFYTVRPGLPGPWVVGTAEVVRYIHPDFTFGRTIWSPPKGDKMMPDGDDYPVDIDFMGEWVAWSATDGRGLKTAIKNVSDPPSAPPSYITAPGAFAQWTDDGNLLFSNMGVMTIVDRNGDTIRSFPLPYGGVAGVASMRRYWHR